MRKDLSRTFKQIMLKSEKKLTEWDLAILEAKEQIDAAKQKTAGLNESISTFQALRDKGVEFPKTNQSGVSV